MSMMSLTATSEKQAGMTTQHQVDIDDDKISPNMAQHTAIALADGHHYKITALLQGPQLTSCCAKL